MGNLDDHEPSLSDDFAHDHEVILSTTRAWPQPMGPHRASGAGLMAVPSTKLGGTASMVPATTIHGADNDIDEGSSTGGEDYIAGTLRGDGHSAQYAAPGTTLRLRWRALAEWRAGNREISSVRDDRRAGRLGAFHLCGEQGRPNQPHLTRSAADPRIAVWPPASPDGSRTGQPDRPDRRAAATAR